MTLPIWSSITSLISTVLFDRAYSFAALNLSKSACFSMCFIFSLYSSKFIIYSKPNHMVILLARYVSSSPTPAMEVCCLALLYAMIGPVASPTLTSRQLLAQVQRSPFSPAHMLNNQGRIVRRSFHPPRIPSRYMVSKFSVQAAPG